MSGERIREKKLPTVYGEPTRIIGYIQYQGRDIRSFEKDVNTGFSAAYQNADVMPIAIGDQREGRVKIIGPVSETENIAAVVARVAAETGKTSARLVLQEARA